MFPTIGGIPRLLAEIPQPIDGGSLPNDPELDDLEGKVQLALNLVAWIGSAAGVVGVLTTGAIMIMSHRDGDSTRIWGRLGLILVACVVVMTAGPVVSWYFSGGS